ncbi:hypothetical protein [Lysinibacillus sp. NPDC086135]|uniref:hypothetical protein n=1 Tax=Lysinibacillus sp. NPDC086135 TaxID=3364130 RepID=UPI00382C5DB4
MITYIENAESLRPKIEVATGKMNEAVLRNQRPNIADKESNIADKGSNIADRRARITDKDRTSLIEEQESLISIEYR